MATQSTPTDSSSSAGASKPTLLAFHGSGSNATVHAVQLARLMRVIKSQFNVEILEAPFPSPAGPGVLPFFDGCGPFKRWLPPSEKVTLEDMRLGRATHTLAPEVEDLIRSTITRVTSSGSPVVGLIGFSQGTKVVAGLLRGLEIRRALGDKAGEVGQWLDTLRFGVSICGSYPPPLIPASIVTALEESGLPEEEEKKKKALLERKIEIPTFHAQGKNDEWHWAGKALIEGHYEVGEGKSVRMEWEMGHHYPVAPEESEQIGKWMGEMLGKAEGSEVAAR
ncbi:hypothetical protein NX059_007086 [Plenodomus lindquistii]|nr:hypothetical protein NX059_007086 [Plenodomus lindquistii]